jgi:hypothetical protein
VHGRPPVRLEDDAAHPGALGSWEPGPFGLGLAERGRRELEIDVAVEVDRAVKQPLDGRLGPSVGYWRSSPWSAAFCTNDGSRILLTSKPLTLGSFAVSTAIGSANSSALGYGRGGNTSFT